MASILKKCPTCPAMTSRSLCQACLKGVAKWFSKHEANRYLAGLCTRCDQPPLEGYVKCALHVIENRVKCKEWQAINGKAKYKMLRKLGLCVHSHTHGPATHGNQCKDCRKRYRKSQRRCRQTKRVARVAIRTVLTLAAA